MTYPYNTPAYILNKIKATAKAKAANTYVDPNVECKCCGEDVGAEDAKAIDEQLEKREKICIWCGNDFDLSEEEIVQVLENNEIDFDGALKHLNNNSRNALNQIRDKIVDTNEFDYILRDVELEISVEKTEEWISERKQAILETFGIDIEKEKFEPGYADSSGNPRDRIADGVAFEQADKDQLVHRILLFVDKNPECNTSDLVNSSRYSKTAKHKKINESPAARMVAAGLLKCTSKFCGLYKHTNHNHVSRYFGQIPRFKRKFTLTKKGKGVLKEFKNGKTRVLL